MGFVYAYVRNWNSIQALTLLSFSIPVMYLSIKDINLYSDTNKKWTYLVFVCALIVFLFGILSFFYLGSYSDSIEKKLNYTKIQSQKLNDDMNFLENTPDYLGKQTLDNEGRVISQSKDDNNSTNTYKSTYSDKAQSRYNYPKKYEDKKDKETLDIQKNLTNTFFYEIKQEV